MLCNGEVVTMEIVGKYLDLERDNALFGYFREHYEVLPIVKTTKRQILSGASD
jgi:hypothetical protein